MEERDINTVPVGAKRSNSDLYKELRKADKELMEALMKPIEDIAKEAKAIALEANHKASNRPPCVQEKNIKSIWKTLNTGKTLKIGTIIAIIGIIALAIGNYFAFKDSIDDTQDELMEVKSEVAGVKDEITSVKSDVQKVKVIVEEDRKHEDRKGKEQIEEIKSALTEIIKEHGRGGVR